jgi:transposase
VYVRRVLIGASVLILLEFISYLSVHQNGAGSFRKKPSDLSETEILARLLEYSPSLRVAYELRLNLTAIFDQKLTKAEATPKIKDWCQDVQQSGLTCFDSFLITLNNHFDQITNYFINRLNSGFVEGFNNKVKVLKRRCYGLLNLGHLFQRLFLDLEGYSLFARF